MPADAANLHDRQNPYESFLGPTTVNHQISVVIEREDQETETIDAELVDVSQGGAKLKTDKRLSIDDEVTLDISPDGSDRRVTVVARICWARPSKDDQFWIGCRFNPRLPQSLLVDLAEGGYLERREYRREDIALKALARWELTPDDVEMRLADYSSGGFCLLSEEPGTAGKRILLHLDNEDGEQVLVSGKAQWQVESEEGFRIGCEFVNQGGYQMVRGILRGSDADVEEKSNKRSIWKRFLWRR